jgi:hypothetical protein
MLGGLTHLRFYLSHNHFQSPKLVFELFLHHPLSHRSTVWLTGADNSVLLAWLPLVRSCKVCCLIRHILIYPAITTGIVCVLSLINFAIAVHIIVVADDYTDHYLTLAGLGLAAAVLSLLSLPLMQVSPSLITHQLHFDQ